jgi:phage FluMu gp28-like protein
MMIILPLMMITIKTIMKQQTNKYFLPYQQRWLADKSKVKLFVKSRRIGGTYVQSFEDVEDCLYQRVPSVWFSSADESAAKEYILYCEMWAKFFDAGLKILGDTALDKKGNIKTLSIEFRNGTRINAISSSPKAFRSKGGKAILDEFAHHKDPVQMWKAAKPVTTWGYPIRMLSTHNGDSQFYKFQQAIQSGSLNWSMHAVDIFTAVREGLLDKILGHRASEEEKYNWLEQEKKDCFDEYTWLEEYCCMPQTGKNVFIDYPLISSCEEDGLLWQNSPLFSSATPDSSTRQTNKLPGNGATLPQCDFAAAKEPQNDESKWIWNKLNAFDEWLKNLEISGSLYIGYDIGRKKDLSVIWIIEKLGSIKITRMLIVLDKTRFWVQEEILYRLLSLKKTALVCIDSTGLGMQLAERAIERFGHSKVEAINFASGNIRTEMAFYTKKCFEERSVLIPPSADVREDIHSMKRVVTTAGNVRLQAEKETDVSGHADRFWGLALSLHAAQNDFGPLIVTSRRRRESGGILNNY